jgi:hypothetical protein
MPAHQVGFDVPVAFFYGLCMLLSQRFRLELYNALLKSALEALATG